MVLGWVEGWFCSTLQWQVATYRGQPLFNSSILRWSIFTTDPAERRGSRDKRRISLAVASELVLVEDYYERPQRYCQMTRLMWKCSPNNQRLGPAPRAGHFGPRLQPSKVLLNLFFSGDQVWAEFTAGCMNVSAGSSSLFTQRPIYHRAAEASPHAESAASGEV